MYSDKIELSIFIRPFVGFNNPLRRSINVVLPKPLKPLIIIKSFLFIVKDKF